MKVINSIKKFYIDMSKNYSIKNRRNIHSTNKYVCERNVCDKYNDCSQCNKMLDCKKFTSGFVLGSVMSTIFYMCAIKKN